MEILLSYLIGALPTAYLLAKLKGLDLRQHGSGNIGATNAWRVLGKKIGVITLLLDILKGLVAVIVIARVFPFKMIGDLFLRELTCGLAAILGHNFPVYLKFRGGKGVATSLGVFLGLAPKLVGAVFFLWAGIFLITGYVSLASMVAGLLLPVFSLLFAYPRVMHWFSLGLGILILIQHRANLKRLLKGEEKKFFRK